MMCFEAGCSAHVNIFLSVFILYCLIACFITSCHLARLYFLMARTSSTSWHVPLCTHQQCVTLCWKSTPSLLHGVDGSRTVAQIQLQPDNWWVGNHCSTTLRFLTTTANFSLGSTSNLAGVSLLRQQRNIHMSALHHIAGLTLFHGNATKLVKCTYVYYAFSFHMKFYKLNLES